MSKKRERVDVSGPPETLTDNPFASLADQLPKDLPKQTNKPAPSEASAEILPPQGLDYRVERTKKGNYDLAFERRAKGKGVTLLRRVHGDGEALLKNLKQRCGAGGVFRENTIELQGDHRQAIEVHLREAGL